MEARIALLNALIKPILPILGWVWDRFRKGVRGRRLSLPSEMLRVVSNDQRTLQWHKGRNMMTNTRIMSVRGNFYATNVYSGAEVVITRGFLVVSYWKWGWPRRKTVEGHVLLADGSPEPYRGAWSGPYRLAPGETREMIADWTLDPAIKVEGKPLRARAYFVDQLGNVHGTKPEKLTYHFGR